MCKRILSYFMWREGGGRRREEETGGWAEPDRGTDDGS